MSRTRDIVALLRLWIIQVCIDITRGGSAAAEKLAGTT